MVNTALSLNQLSNNEILKYNCFRRVVLIFSDKNTHLVSYFSDRPQLFVLFGYG